MSHLHEQAWRRILALLILLEHCEVISIQVAVDCAALEMSNELFEALSGDVYVGGKARKAPYEMVGLSQMLDAAELDRQGRMGTVRQPGESDEALRVRLCTTRDNHTHTI